MGKEVSTSEQILEQLNWRYAVKQYDSGYFYQRMEIHDKSLTYTAVDSEGAVKDTFTIRK